MARLRFKIAKFESVYLTVYVDARSRPLNAPANTSARDLAGSGRFSGARRNCAYVNTFKLHTYNIHV